VTRVCVMYVHVYLYVYIDTGVRYVCVYVYVYVYKVLYLLSLADAFVAQGMPDSAARVYRQALSGDVCVSLGGGGGWGGGRECVYVSMYTYVCMFRV
jgi:hypothetical protein